MLAEIHHQLRNWRTELPIDYESSIDDDGRKVLLETDPNIKHLLNVLQAQQIFDSKIIRTASNFRERRLKTPDSL